MTASGLVMPTRILIVGGGAREHALAWKLSVEPGVNEVIVAPGSYAIGAEPRVRALKDVDPPAAIALATKTTRSASSGSTSLSARTRGSAPMA